MINPINSMSFTPYDPENCLLPMPKYVNFGQVKIGQSIKRVVEITNTLENPLKLTLSSFDNQFTLNKTTIRLSPGESKSVEIIFTPDKEDFKSTQIKITTDSSCFTRIIISGRGFK